MEFLVGIIDVVTGVAKNEKDCLKSELERIFKLNKNKINSLNLV